MSKGWHYLSRLGNNWQSQANADGEKPVKYIYNLFMDIVISKYPHYKIDNKPKDLKHIYRRGHGIVPDLAIRNSNTGKSIYLEVKRQNAGGNAHERACKYFTPGIIKAAKEHGKLGSDVFPFWMIFTGGMADSKKYQEEITFWFLGVEEHLLLWSEKQEASQLIEHFDKHIAPLLA